ncbi:MAG: nucleoside-diphosphate sugar epimerase/dehydratase [Proteiniphilum sp.]|nr:nucleoside-diphosphate sugar epimerase/dehydratase [Proteiniphilum sp.]MDD2725760.1 nucleoside-diphosphate sugar epimerase/dehydratase [Proteiniphilum sp.]MDD3554993.1 nucleoside-diphosphate sugar epimerase/dehydratase [Proteiniphilum sp.]MDD3978569.1 nucleoside-diphosphate sugar epimerase/dehydratase [Proteiniphilum sp.]MDY0183397.1 nucleoside-diphosphate sugar epimerase/dehydratase [Proteiniphilum sp.]
MKMIFQNYISNRVLSRFTIFLIDLLMILFSCISMYIVRFGFSGLTPEVRTDGITLTLLLILFNTISFVSFRTFSGILRFSSFTDLLRIVWSLMLGYLLAYITVWVIKRFFPLFSVSHVTFIAIFFLNMFLMIFSRILVKETYESIAGRSVKPMNIFIYGTKQAGISVAKALKGNNEFNYRVLGFISDEHHMIGKQLMGVTIHANDENLFRTLETKDVKTIIVSPQKMEEIKNSNLLVNFVDHNIALLTTVPVNEWSGTIMSKEQIKDIEIEDLLPRDPIQVNMLQIAENLEGKRVMVTGAAGSIGSEIVRQVASFNPYSIILIDQAETPLHNMRLELQEKWRDLRTEIIVADISNAPRMEKLFARTRPQYIFHAAAYKHVPMMEDNVSESVQTNILGAKIVADLAVKYNARKFVMVSTDKAVNPSNVMGCSKRICEIYVQSLAKHLEKTGLYTTQFITTRFGNVLGSNGSVIPLFRDQIRNGGPVTVTHPEIIRYFMTIPEACQLVLEAGALGHNGEIYIFDMGKPVKILDLAKRMIRLSGTPNVKIEFTGLRHGEKLYEELLNLKELTKPTHHEKIMIAEVREYEYAEVSQQIDNLIKVSYDYDDMRTVKKMKEMVPEFRSINSPYEAVDRLLDKITNGAEVARKS